LRTEALHLLSVVDQWTKGSNRTGTLCDGVFNHLHGAFNAETKSILFSK
jgi:hypothetical protein